MNEIEYQNVINNAKNLHFALKLVNLLKSTNACEEIISGKQLAFQTSSEPQKLLNYYQKLSLQLKKQDSIKFEETQDWFWNLNYLNFEETIKRLEKKQEKNLNSILKIPHPFVYLDSFGVLDSIFNANKKDSTTYSHKYQYFKQLSSYLDGYFFRVKHFMPEYVALDFVLSHFIRSLSQKIQNFQTSSTKPRLCTEIKDCLNKIEELHQLLNEFTKDMDAAPIPFFIPNRNYPDYINKYTSFESGKQETKAQYSTFAKTQLKIDETFKSLKDYLITQPKSKKSEDPFQSLQSSLDSFIKNNPSFFKIPKNFCFAGQYPSPDIYNRLKKLSCFRDLDFFASNNKPNQNRVAVKNVVQNTRNDVSNNKSFNLNKITVKRVLPSVPSGLNNTKKNTTFQRNAGRILGVL